MSGGQHAQFEPEEQKAILAQVAAGAPALCPRDGTPMTKRSIGGGSFGLGYQRKRDWFVCSHCRRSAIFDLKRGTRN